MYNDFNDNTIGAGAFCCSQRIGAVASHRGDIDLYSYSKAAILQKEGMSMGIYTCCTSIGSSKSKNLS